MIVVMLISLISAEGNPEKIGSMFFRLVMITTILGVIMGVVFTPRSWCQICPMGYASGEIANKKKKR